MLKFTKSLLVSAATLATFVGLTSTAQASDIVKQARSNDVASQYVLEDDGDFYRMVGKHKCQITTKVDEFKISRHPNDAAMVYFVKNNDLWVLHNAQIPGHGQCPAASKTTILEDIAKAYSKVRYTLVNTIKTKIVNAAMSTKFNGLFVAWDNTTPVFQAANVKDYLMNTCYGTPKKKYNTYVAFVLTNDKKVIKVKGKKPESSVVDNKKTYASLQEFKSANKVCSNY
ncbi:MAG: hypothetical protein ACPG4T_04375 [Nannocystaceae bacterium]